MKCTSIAKIESIADGDILEVSFDDFSKALWFYHMTDAVQYIDKEVIVSYRQDMYKGQVRQFINTFVEPCKITTIDKKEHIRLYAENEDNYSNMCFNDIAMGETKNGCILYCVSQKFETSEKAVWVTFTVRDKLLRIAKLRLFHYDRNNDFTGKYVCCALTRNEFGFRTDMIAPANGECPENYEIGIALTFLTDYFHEDQEALTVLENTGILHILKEYMDIEKGYMLVRFAQEIALCDALYNISGSINVRAIAHALLADKLHLLKQDSHLSASVRNVFMAARYKWANTEIVLMLIDAACENPPAEKEIYINIKNTIDSVIRASKCIR